MNLPFLSDLSRRRIDDEAAKYADRADIARINEARTDEERLHVVSGLRARARFHSR